MQVNINGFTFGVRKIDETHVELTYESGTSGPRVHHIAEFQKTEPLVYQQLMDFVNS